MIINAFTILMLFVSLITSLLSLILLLTSLFLYKKTSRLMSPEEKSLFEERSQLLFIIASTVFLIRLILWPFFYVTLHSYIPLVEGSMCIFGVTQVQPGFSTLLQIIKPFVFFSIGGWFILNKIDERTGIALLQAKRLLILSGASIIALLDSIGDLIYFPGFEMKRFVACCTTVFDFPEKRVTSRLSSVFLGERYQEFVMPAYYISNLLLISLMLFNIIYYRHRNRYPLGLVVATALISITNAIVTIVATFERIGPEVMRTPLHHCLFCLWQHVPASILFSLFFIIGTYSALWAMIIQFFRHKGFLSEIIDNYTKKLYLAGIILIFIKVFAISVRLSFVNFN